MQRCPLCSKPIVVDRIAPTLYRIECTSNYCEYEEDFEYVTPVRPSLTKRPRRARVVVAR
jgi:hypothetical protein